MRHDDTIEATGGTDATSSPIAGRAARIMGVAAFLLASIAFVAPALSGECEDTADVLRVAAREAGLTCEELFRIEHAIDRALSHRANGDELGCLSELAELRRLLSTT